MSDGYYGSLTALFQRESSALQLLFERTHCFFADHKLLSFAAITYSGRFHERVQMSTNPSVLGAAPSPNRYLAPKYPLTLDPQCDFQEYRKNITQWVETI